MFAFQETTSLGNGAMPYYIVQMWYTSGWIDMLGRYAT